MTELTDLDTPGEFFREASVTMADLLDTPSASVESYPIHFLGAVNVVVRGGMIPDARTCVYGDTLHVTDEIREMNTDRAGNSWLSKITNEAWQIARWGEVRVRLGVFPSDQLPKYKPGSLEFQDARESARLAAHAILDRTEKAAALAQVISTYGPQPVSSKTLFTTS